MKNRVNNKGSIDLFSVSLIFILCAIIMITLTAIHLPVLKQVLRFHEYQAAYAAAVTGQKYAWTTIEKNYKWEANGWGDAYSAGSSACFTNDFRVTENPSGKYCVGEFNNGYQKFYISFEYNPNISKYISYNLITKNSVDETAGTPLHTSRTRVDANTVLIVSRGVCGDISVYVEAVYRLSGVAGIDAAAIASKKINIKMGSSSGTKLNVDSNNLLEPKICSNDQFDGPEGASSIFYEGAEATFNGGKAVTYGQNVKLPANIDTEKGVKTKINTLSLGQVSARLEAIGGTGIALRAGTYNIPALNKIEYRIGDALVKTYTSSAEGGYVPVRVGDANDRLMGMKLAGTTLSIINPQKVEPAGSVTQLTIQGTAGQRVKVVMKPEGGSHPYLLNDNAGGDIKVSGELSGEGSVVSNGNITFEGKSMFNTTVDNGVAIFAEKDVILNPIPSGVADLDAETGAFQTRFVAVGKKIYRSIAGGTPSNNYDRLKTDSINNVLPKLAPSVNSSGREDYTIRNTKIHAAKSYLETEGLLSSDSKEYNLFRAWILNGFEFLQTDAIFYGLIYTKNNFRSSIDGKLTLVGALIVNATSSDYGNIILNEAARVNFIYDPSYLGIFQDLYNTCELTPSPYNIL